MELFLGARWRSKVLHYENERHGDNDDGECGISTDKCGNDGGDDGGESWQDVHDGGIRKGKGKGGNDDHDDSKCGISKQWESGNDDKMTTIMATRYYNNTISK